MPLLSLIVIALMVFALVDIIRRDDSQVRYMPKFVWLLLVVLLPFLGSVLWFALGREYDQDGIRLGRGEERREAPRRATPPARTTIVPTDTRTTEQQIADLDREIEEWRLRQEIEKRKREQSDPSTGSAAQEG